MSDERMRIVRFRKARGGSAMYGLWRGDYVRAIVASPFEGMIVGTSEHYDLKDVELLAPCTPSKIVAIGLNYRDHAEELGMALPEEPLIFLKPPSSVIGPMAEIVLPEMSSQVEHEAELAVVIGKKARNVSRDDALSYVLGYTCVNDVTARDLQRKDIQFTRSKSFDTFCPVGPWIVTELDPSDLEVSCTVNGKVRQRSRTSLLVHSVPELISFISCIMTLEPGDIIPTGTPFGVGKLESGDEVTVSVEGVGELTNFVR